MWTSGAHELHQLVTQRNSLGQVDAHRPSSVIAQSLDANHLGRGRRILRRFGRLLNRCHGDTVAERNGSLLIWAADGLRCPNRRQSAGIERNPCSRERQAPRLHRAENPDSSNSLRRESLYPAELSGQMPRRLPSLPGSKSVELHREGEVPRLRQSSWVSPTTHACSIKPPFSRKKAAPAYSMRWPVGLTSPSAPRCVPLHIILVTT